MSYKTFHTEEVFQYINQYENGKYKAYRVPENAIILFSVKTGKPLAGLTFSAVNSPQITRTILCQPDNTKSNPQRFQGLINTDNQTIKLGVTNLTKFQMNFNLMLTDEKVNVVNPGGINQINELRAGEHYWVEVDQNKNNTRLILASLTETMQDGSKIALSVGRDEKLAKEQVVKTKGTYIYLSVVPQYDVPEKNLFEHTLWKSVDYILLEQELGENLHGLENIYGVVNTRRRDGMRHIDGYINSLRAMNISTHTNNISMTSGTLTSQNILDDGFGNVTLDASNISGNIQTVGRLEREYNEEKRGQREYVEHEDEDEDEGDFESAEIEEDNEVVDTPRVGLECSVSQFQSNERSTMMQERYQNIDRLETMTDKSADLPPPGSTVQVRRDLQEIVNCSTAAQLISGERLEVSSQETGIEYDYNLMSCGCVVGLSVDMTLTFSLPPGVPQPYEMEVEAIKETIKLYQEAEYTKYFEIKTYPAVDCIICLCDKPTLVFYRCGHQCCHPECDPDHKITSCPVCRAAIVARITRPYVEIIEKTGKITTEI